MRILGDLTENKPDADLSTARVEKASVVGDFPLETKAVRPASYAQSAESAEPDEPPVYAGHNGGRPGGGTVGVEDREPPRQEASRSGSGAGPWVAIVLLVIALLAVSGYSYLGLRKNNISLSQLPGLTDLVGSLGGRMNAAEAQLGEFSSKWSGLADRVTALDRKVTVSLSKSHQQTLALVAAAESRMNAQMDNRTQALDTRLARVESDQAEDKARLAQAEDQMHQEVAGLRQEMGGNRDSTARDLAGLRRQVDQGQNDVRALNQQVARQRVDFEATRNTAVELAPGVTLTVLKTNVSYQRFEGYLSLTQEGRTLWLRNAGLRQGLSFYSKEDDRPYALVVTNVNRNGVVGYLLVPVGTLG